MDLSVLGCHGFSSSRGALQGKLAATLSVGSSRSRRRMQGAGTECGSRREGGDVLSAGTSREDQPSALDGLEASRLAR